MAGMCIIQFNIYAKKERVRVRTGPSKMQANLNRVTCDLKEGLDISKLSTTGADFELISREDKDEEEEEERAVEEKLAYERNLLQHLNPECIDLVEEEEETGEDDGNGSAMVSGGIVRCSVEPWWYSETCL